MKIIDPLCENAEFATLSDLIVAWSLKKQQLRDQIRITGTFTKDDIAYWMPGVNYITDFSLIYDHMPFEFKPPRILRSLWASTMQSTANLVNEIISWEKIAAKRGKIVEMEITHVIYLKQLATYVLSRKFKMDRINIKKIIAGDTKSKDHFTVIK